MEANYNDRVNYMELANKILNKKMLPGWVTRDRDELIGVIVEALVNADIDFNPNLGSPKRDVVYKRRSYRTARVIYAIKTYKDNLRKNALKKQRIDDAACVVARYRKSESPLDVLIKREELEALPHKIDFLLNNSGLTDSQKQRVKFYYLDGYTMENIGRKENPPVSKQGINFCLNKAINKMKMTAGVLTTVK